MDPMAFTDPHYPGAVPARSAVEDAANCGRAIVEAIASEPKNDAEETEMIRVIVANGLGVLIHGLRALVYAAEHVASEMPYAGKGT